MLKLLKKDLKEKEHTEKGVFEEIEEVPVVSQEENNEKEAEKEKEEEKKEEEKEVKEEEKKEEEKDKKN